MNDDHNSGDFYDGRSTRPSRTYGSGGNGLAIASIVIGAGSIFLIWLKFFLLFLSIFFVLLAVIGIFMAVAAKRRNEAAGYPSGLATVGLVLNIISLVINAVSFVACVACVACIANVITMF